MNVEIFADRLKIERKRLFLSQVEMAEKCKVSATTYSNYELSKRKPDAEFLQNFSDIGGDVQFLFTGSKSGQKLDSLEQMALTAFNKLQKEGQKANAITYMVMLESGFLKGGIDELESISKENNKLPASITQIAQDEGKNNNQVFYGNVNEVNGFNNK